MPVENIGQFQTDHSGYGIKIGQNIFEELDFGISSAKTPIERFPERKGNLICEKVLSISKVFIDRLLAWLHGHGTKV